jgi:predicted secreted protein
MSATNSTDLKLYVDAVAVACATDATLSITHTTREVLCKDTLAWTDRLPGMRSWSASGSGLHAMDAVNGGYDLTNLAIDRQLVYVKFATAATGDTYLAGSGYVTECTINSPGAEENCTYSFTIEGSGDLVTGANA